MTETSIFEWLSAELETRARLSRLEARGTVRLLLKQAGLDPATVRTQQMHVVVSRLMPHALDRRGVTNAAGLCQELAAALLAQKSSVSESATDTPYDVFERLDGGTRSQKR